MLRVSSDWLENYSKRTGKGHKAKATLKKKTNVLGEIEKELKRSPHAIALELLDKDPDRIKGNQEHYEQVRVFHYFERHHPDIYQRLAATPNGGMRSKATAGKMKAEGQKRGYPDMSLDVPKGIYHGMKVELKYGSNRLSEEQVEYLQRLRADGYYSVLCVGWNEVVEAIMAYYHLNSGESLPLRERDAKWAA